MREAIASIRRNRRREGGQGAAAGRARTPSGPAAVIVPDGDRAPSQADDWYGPLARVRDAGEADLGLALALARELGVDLPLADLARGRLAEALGLPR